MTRTPSSIVEFLAGKRIAVAGVSRQSRGVGNAIFHKLRDTGFEVLPINPNATEIEGIPCYPDVTSIPGDIDGVVIATHPDAALGVVRKCAEKGVRRVWFHRSFGAGSASDEAAEECKRRGITAIVGGCPLMYCEPVDRGHRCFRWWLQLTGRVPG
ncbi:MAG: CoA-binding protein [Alphaproteobacteria bacterium]|nr:CoA-binding protein [Alphaproteobacteria bacterium]